MSEVTSTVRGLSLGACLLATVACLLATTSVRADSTSSLERGITLYEEGALDAAITELELAYREDPSAAVCYALGQALRKSGQATKAISYFRCAVEKTNVEAVARAARYQIGRCVLEGGADPLAPTTSEVRPAATVAVEPKPSAWWRDPAGGALLGIGFAGALSGAVLLGHAEALVVRSRSDLDAFYATSAVVPERVAGGIALSVGGLLALGACIRYVVVARRRH